MDQSLAVAPRQQSGVIISRARLRQFREQRPQEAERLDAIGLGGLNQRVQIRTRGSAADGISEQPITPPDHKRADRVLANVVIDWIESIVQIADQLRPLAEQVMDRLAEQAGWQHRMLMSLRQRSDAREHSRQQPDEGGTDGRTGVSLGLQPTRAVVEQWHKPHEPSLPEVLL